MARDTDPGRKIALIALVGVSDQPGYMLEEVLRYAFDQLCWTRTDGQLDTLLADLKSLMAEDA